MNLFELKHFAEAGRLQFFTEGDALYCSDVKTHETILLGRMARPSREYLKCESAVCGGDGDE